MHALIFFIMLNQDTDLHSSRLGGSFRKEVMVSNSQVLRAVLPDAEAPGPAQQWVSWCKHSSVGPELQGRGH